jgi:DnaJ-class molecular chaperone
MSGGHGPAPGFFSLWSVPMTCPKCKGRGTVGPLHSPWSPCTKCNDNRRTKAKGEGRYVGPRGTGIVARRVRAA